MPEPSRAVFFDFGGTLFSYQGVQGRAFYPILLEAVRRLGVEATAREAGRAYRKASAEAFRAYHSKPYYLHRELFEDGFRRFGERLGGSPKADFIQWFYEQQREMFYAACELRADCLDTLRSLRESGCYLAIVSNIDDDYLQPMVERTGLASVLDDWTSSEEARSCKPDPGIFAHAMSKAKLDATRVLFVGDSAHHDVLGASKMGMRTVLIREPGVAAPGNDESDGTAPDHTIEQLAELLPIASRHLPR